jgi:hypothetical protein
MKVVKAVVLCSNRTNIANHKRPIVVGIVCLVWMHVKIPSI